MLGNNNNNNINSNSSTSSFKRKLIDTFDIFRIVSDEETHLTAHTSHGATISLVCTIFITLLILSEFYEFFFIAPDFKSSMVVNRREMGKTEAVNFNISFTQFPCACLQFEAWQATAGLRLTKQEETLVWQRTRLLGTKPDVTLGLYDSSMGLERTKDEGCRISGKFYIDKVPSNFIFSCAWQDRAKEPPRTDVVFHDLWFGEKRLPKNEISDKLANLLAGTERKGDPPRTIYQYFLSVVPTVVVLDSSYSSITNKNLDIETLDDSKKHLGFQYTATSSTVQAYVSPGVYFAHLHSPISMELVRRGETWSHFLVNIASISGGVYSVSFLLSMAVDYVQQNILNGGDKK